MKLIEYIQGSRRGREANRLERDAMRDPFLADAVEGFDAVYGNHSDKLAELSQRIDKRAAHLRPDAVSHKRQMLIGLSSVAAVVLVGAVGVVWWMQRGAGRSAAEQVGQPLAMADTQPAKPVVAARRSAMSQPEEVQTADAEVQMQSESVAEVVAVEDAVVAEAEPVALDAEPVAVAADSVPAETDAELLAVAAVSEEQPVAEPEEAAAEAVMMTRAVSMEDREIEMEEAAVAGGLRMVHNPEFDAFFAANCKAQPEGERPVEIVVEFRVNDHGVPSAVRILTWYSQETSSEIIMLLVTGPRWEPTGNERICTVVRYE